MDARLLVDVVDVGLRGVRRYDELLGDVVGVAALRQHAQHLALAVGQAVGAGDDLALYMEDTRARHRPLARRGLGAVLALRLEAADRRAALRGRSGILVLLAIRATPDARLVRVVVLGHDERRREYHQHHEHHHDGSRGRLVGETAHPLRGEPEERQRHAHRDPCEADEATERERPDGRQVAQRHVLAHGRQRAGDGEQRPAKQQDGEHELERRGREHERERHHSGEREEEPHGDGLVHTVLPAGIDQEERARAYHEHLGDRVGSRMHRLGGQQAAQPEPGRHARRGRGQVRPPYHAVARVRRLSVNHRLPAQMEEREHAGVGRERHHREHEREEESHLCAREQQARARRERAAEDAQDVGLDGHVEVQARELPVQAVDQAEARSQQHGREKRPQAGQRKPQSRRPGPRAGERQDVLHPPAPREEVREGPGAGQRCHRAQHEAEMRPARRRPRRGGGRDEGRRAQHEERPPVAGDGPHQPDEHARVDEQPLVLALVAHELVHKFRTVILLQRFQPPEVIAEIPPLPLAPSGLASALRRPHVIS